MNHRFKHESNATSSTRKATSLLKTKLTDTLSKNKKTSLIQPIIVTTSCTSNISGATTSKKQKIRSNSESDKVSLNLSSGERLDTASSSKNSSNHSLRGQPLSFEETTSAVAPASAALPTNEGSFIVAGNSSITKTITTPATSSCNHTSNRIDSTIQILEEIIDPIAEEEDDDIDIDNTDEEGIYDLASSAPMKCSIGTIKQPASNSSTPSTSSGLAALKLNVKGKSKTASDNKQVKMNTSKSLNDNSIIVNMNKTKAKSSARTPIASDKSRSNLLLGRKSLKVMPSKTTISAVDSVITDAESNPTAEAVETEPCNTSGNNKKEAGNKLGYNNLIASLLRTTTL